MENAPQIVMLAGPNGAGKSTYAAILIPEWMAFLNADEIAKTLPTYPSAAADLEAGRILLSQWDTLTQQRADFAVETTLANRALAFRIARMKQVGYQFRLAFIWLPDVELAIARVAARVRNGGHLVPEDVIRRRYKAGLKNFFSTYRSLANTWEVYMNTYFGKPVRIASGIEQEREDIDDVSMWNELLKEVHRE